MSAAFFLVAALGASPAEPPPTPTPPARLMNEISAHSELMQNLEELCDRIGPRLSGSRSLQKAQTWAVAKLRAYGATNVHQEPYALGLPWHRGPARAHLVEGSALEFEIAQWGWSEGTPGPVRGEVVVLDAPTLAQLEAAAPRLAGKVLLVKARPRATDEERKNLPAYRARLQKVWRSVPYVAALIPSQMEAGLVEMAGGPNSTVGARIAFIAKDQAAMLERLVAHGLKPTLEIELGGSFGSKPVQEHNVVAEWPGAELPGEVVILGAHLDSWDLGSGATDNGAGVVAFMEVMRALHAAGLTPRRTLRLVLFSGEEQGLLGSTAYLAAHADELERVQAVLVLDAGAGRIVAMSDGQVDSWAEALTVALKPTEVIGPIDVSYARASGSDQETFRRAGLPAFVPRQEPGDYWSHTQHTRLDSLEHVKPADLEQATQVMAVLAWRLLDGPKLPHVAPGAP